MGVPERLRDLDTRRRWARLGAPAWFLAGVVMVALCNAALVVLALAGWVRLHSWWSGTVWEDSDVWHWLPGGVLAMTALAFLISFAYLALHGISAAPKRVIRATQARPSRPDEFPQVHNVATELAIGLGVTPPALYVTADQAPNALSAHGFRKRVIVHTAGLAALPRAEIEAMLAHEMGHLHAADARWVTAASVSLGHAKQYTKILMLLAGLLFGVFVLGWQAGDVLLVSWLLAAILLAVVGGIADMALGAAKHRVRKDADDVADVVGVRLARHPEALGQLLQRLEHETSVVEHSTWRTAMLWFEEMPEPGEEGGADARILELRRRASAAYATANVLPPPAAPGTPSTSPGNAHPA
jgi:Zn-dependent protease with chaperone function